MATVQQVVQLVFEGVDQASDTTKKVGAALQELDGKVADLAAPFADLADKILKLDAVLLGAAATIGVLSVREAAKFETALADLQKVLSSGEGEATQYADRLKELALQYGVNANELVLSAADFRRSGNEIETSVTLVKQALDLMLAGGVSAAEATEILKASLAGFQIPADQTTAAATRIGDVLNFIADNSESSFRELATGFKDLAPVAKLTGLSFEEIAASLAVVIGVGNTGAEAANGLGVSFARLIGPTGQAAEVMKELGVTFDATGKPIGSVKTILEAIIPSWNQLTDEQKFNNAATIVGLDQAKRFIPLLDGWAKAQDLVGLATEKATGSVEYQVKVALATAETQYARTTEALRQLGQVMGDQLLVSTTAATGGVGDLATAFQQVIESGKLKPVFDLINGAAGELGETLRIMAGNLGKAFEGVDLDPFVEALRSLGEQVKVLFRNVFGEIDLQTVEGLTEFIQKIINGFTALTATTEGILRAFEPLFSAIGRLVEEFSTLDRESALDFGEFLGSMKLLVDQGTLLGGVLLALAQTGRDVGAALDVAFGGLSFILNALTVPLNLVETAFLKIKETALATGLAMEEIKPSFLQDEAKIEATKNALIEVQARLFELAKDRFESGQALDESAARIKKGFEGLATGAEQSGGAIDQWGTKVTGGAESLQGLIDATIEATGGAEDLREEIKKPIPVTEWDGMLSRLDELAGSFGDATDGVKGLNDAQEEFSKQDLLKGFDNVALGSYVDSLGRVVTTYDQIGSGTVKATGHFAEVKDKTKDAADALNDLVASGKLTADQLWTMTKNAQDFEAKMEEIASNERIKTIEATIQLNIAALEADARRVEAIFASIDTTINSTGELLGTLFGLLGDAGTYDKLDITEQIDLENRRRQEALDLQKKLTEAEIARIEAQTRRFDRADPFIQISADGLEPELEAFMWKILQKTRMRVNQEYGDFLLGLEPA